MSIEQLSQETISEITKTTKKISKEFHLHFDQQIYLCHELSNLVNKSLKIANGIFEPTMSVAENWKNLGRKRRA